MSAKFPYSRFFSRSASFACLLSASVAGDGQAQGTVPAPPAVTAEPVAMEAAAKPDKSLIPIPGFLKKDEADQAPLLQQTSRQAAVKPDLANMDANGINIPELERIPETDLPEILQSADAKEKAVAAEKGGLPFGLFAKDEPVASAPPVQMAPVTPVVSPVSAAPSERVETLRAAETQAASFTAALAVASDGVPVAPAPAPVLEEPESDGFLKNMGSMLKRDEPVAGSASAEEKGGMLSSLGGVFKKDEQPEAVAETFPEPVASEKEGLFSSGLFGKKDKEPDALQTPVPGLSDIGEPVATEEKKGFRLPKLFGGGEE